MRSGRIILFAAAMSAVFLMSAPAPAQSPSAPVSLPAGFKVVQQTNMDAMTIVKAQKANEGLPPAWAHVNIELTYTLTKWLPDEGADAEEIEGMKEVFGETMEQYFQAPQERDTRQPGSPMRYEVCGKQRYHDGVLTCLRYTEKYTGGTGAENVPDLVTYKLNWMGKGEAGSIGIEIFHYSGDKEAALGLIDDVIAGIAAKK